MSKNAIDVAVQQKSEDTYLTINYYFTIWKVITG